MCSLDLNNNQNKSIFVGMRVFIKMQWIDCDVLISFSKISTNKLLYVNFINFGQFIVWFKYPNLNKINSIGMLRLTILSFFKLSHGSSYTD